MADDDDTATPRVGGTQVLLQHFDIDFRDATGRHTAITANDTYVSVATSNPKFGPGSLYGNTSAGLTISDNLSDFTFTGDFTVDCWFDPTVFGYSGQGLFDIGNASLALHTGYYWTGSANIVVLQATVGALTLIDTTGQQPTGAWYHCAVTRQGSTVYLFTNGVLVASGTDSSTLTPASSGVTVGTFQPSYYPIQGYIDELRVINGAAAWIANFTPPTSPYLPADAVPVTGTLAITQANQTVSAAGNVPQPPKTFWILNTAAPSPNYYGQLQDGGTTPTAVLSSYGWTVAKSATAYWQAHLGASALATTSASSSYIDSKTGPTVGTGATNTTSGDAFISPTNYSGIFASGNWTFSLGMRTAAVGSFGRFRCRVWASANANGSSARELTSGALVGSTVSMSATGTTYTSSVTWAAPQIVLNNEYLFFQLEWNVTSAGTNTTSSAQFYVSAASIGTTSYTPSIIGALAVTETPDTISATGNVPVVLTGTLAITQAAQTLSAAGGPRVGGTLGLTQANQTISATGAPAATGTLSITQAAQTLSATGNVPMAAITGTLAITQANQTLSAAGGPRVGGTLTVTQANQTLSATGSVILVGNLTVTQAAQTLVAAGGPVAGAHLTVTQANETLSAAGTVAIGGTLNVTQANNTLVAAGGVTVRGTLSVNQAAQTISATGSVLSGIVGTLNVTQANQTLSAAGNVPNVIGGSLHVTQANQTLSATGTVFTGITGTLAITQANQTLSATGTIPIGPVTGTLVITQGAQTLSATGTAPGPGIEAMHTLSRGSLYVAGSVKTAAGPVSGLPHPGRVGTRNFVTDATVPLASGVGNIVTGGGSNRVPVYDDGANWRIG